MILYELYPVYRLNTYNSYQTSVASLTIVCRQNTIHLSNRNITANTSTFTLTGYDLGGTSGITFSSPVAGSGNGIIGGGM